MKPTSMRIDCEILIIVRTFLTETMHVSDTTTWMGWVWISPGRVRYRAADDGKKLNEMSKCKIPFTFCQVLYFLFVCDYIK